MILAKHTKPRFSNTTTKRPNLKVKALVSAVAAASCGIPNAYAAELEEIIVTATRREQTVLDIPYNISAFSEADLARARTTSLSDLTRLVPGLFTIDQGPALSIKDPQIGAQPIILSSEGSTHGQVQTTAISRNMPRARYPRIWVKRRSSFP